MSTFAACVTCQHLCPGHMVAHDARFGEFQPVSRHQAGGMKVVPENQLLCKPLYLGVPSILQEPRFREG